MYEKPISLLLIEDTSTDAEILQRILRASALRLSSIVWVQSIAEATRAFEENEFDLVLTDLGLQDSVGTGTVAIVKQLSGQSPIIALTGQHDDGMGILAIQLGASDYFPKNQLSEPVISRAIAYAIERSQLTANIVDANRQLTIKNERLAQMYRMSQQFVDNVSHEFRTPLTVIREFAAILRDGIDGPVTSTQKCRLSTLINRTDDLATMVDDLLDTSRLEAGLLKTRRNEHDLVDIIDQVVKMLNTRAKTKGIRISVRDIPLGLAVYCDEEKLRRVLINLLVNAIKFTPVRGVIEIFVEMADEDRVRIAVVDNGPGIAAEDISQIFERFQQVEDHHRMASCKGFGLGLSIARALAALNLGGLEVSSKEGLGSRFSVLVPIARVESILSCYFEQRLSMIDDNPALSLFEVYADNEENEMVDELLSSCVKSFDLVLKTQENRWIVCICNFNTPPSEFQMRVSNDWARIRRNHYGASLPNLVLEHKGSVNVVDGREVMMNLVAPMSQPLVGNPRILPKQIVIFDDEVDVAGAIQSRLVAEGFEVAIAHDGLSGLKAVEALQPEVILLDIRMPKMDGLEVLRRLRSNPLTVDTPVIVLSASLSDRQRVLDKGANFFIQKPFQSESLLAALSASVEEYQLSAAGALR